MISKTEVMAAVGSRLMRLVTSTLRVRVLDRAGITDAPSRLPNICAFWHNRLFLMPHIYERYLSSRIGCALTSASKDGDLVAAFLQCFGIEPIRGSSSRRGAAALIEMKRATDQGWLVGITPDGPRGPRYHLNPGVVKLAQTTGSLVLPVHIKYSRFWRLKARTIRIAVQAQIALPQLARAINRPLQKRGRDPLPRMRTPYSQAMHER